jgi:hypothetical protein
MPLLFSLELTDDTALTGPLLFRRMTPLPLSHHLTDDTADCLSIPGFDR